MFFLLRSAVCIGLVVAACPDPVQPTRAVAALPGPALVLTSAEHLCRAAPGRCLGLLREGLRAGSAEAYAALASQGRVLPSHDTLTADDRRAGWTDSLRVASD